MADEGDAEHLPGLALVPVGARRRPGSSVSIAERRVGEVDLERDAEAPLGVRATRANTWKRVSPPAYARGDGRCRLGPPAGRTGSSSLRPYGDGIQSMAERKSKNVQPQAVAGDARAGLAPSAVAA